MLTSRFVTASVPMPVCTYQILDGPPPDGQPVDFVAVGQPVFHKWNCVSEAVDTFCMVIHPTFPCPPCGRKEGGCR